MLSDIILRHSINEKFGNIYFVIYNRSGELLYNLIIIYNRD